MILRITNLKFAVVLMALTFGFVGNTWAQYYARVTAHAIGADGGGTVLVTSNGTHDEAGTECVGYGYNNTRNRNVSFTLTATANPNYEFVKWTDANNVDGATASTDNPYTRNYRNQTTNRWTGEGNASTYDIYAVFAERELYYFTCFRNINAY